MEAMGRGRTRKSKANRPITRKTHSSEVISVTSPGLISGQTNEKAVGLCNDQHSPTHSVERKSSDHFSPHNSGLEKSADEGLKKFFLKECLRIKLSFTKIDKLLSCQVFEVSLTKRDLAPVRRDCLNASEAISSLQLNLLEGMHIYSCLQTQLESLDEKCNQLLKQCAILTNKMVPSNGAEHTSSYQTLPKVLEKRHKTLKISIDRSHTSPFTFPYNFQTQESRQVHQQPASNIPFATSHFVAPAVPPPEQYSHPSSRLFDGNPLKYHTFKRKFKGCVEEAYQDFNIRMSFLEETCVGKALDVISELSCFEDRQYACKIAWERLDKRFGNQRKLLSLVKEGLISEPPIKEWDAYGLMNLCDLMYKCETSFRAWGKEGLLDSDELMQGLFQRLPYRIRAKFVSIDSGDNDSGTFEKLRELVESAAAEADSSYGKLMQQSNSKSHNSNKFKGVCAAVQHPSNQSLSTQSVQSCVLCKASHDIRKCSALLKKSIQERKQVVRECRLCYNCLRLGHRILECKSKISCCDCGKRHHTLLHLERSNSETNTSSHSESSKPSVLNNDDVDQFAAISASTSFKKNSLGSGFTKQTIFKVVPVKVWHNDSANYECTYASIDEGSNVNLCAASLASRLGVPISQRNVELMTTNAISTIKHKVNDLAVLGIDESSMFRINEALIMDEIVDVNSSISTKELASLYSHLQNVSFPEIKDGKVELLLVVTCTKLTFYKTFELVHQESPLVCIPFWDGPFMEQIKEINKYKFRG